MSDFQVIRRTSAPVKEDVRKDISSLFLGADMSDDEREIIATVFEHTDAKIDVMVPDNINSEELARHFTACTKAFSRIGMAQKKLFPVLGRLFCLIQGRKDVITLMGAKNFNDFINRVVPKTFNISRNDAYSCMRVAREFPQITVSSFEGLTPAKLRAIARYLPYNKGMISEKELNLRNSLVEDAKRLHYEDLIYKMHDMGIVDKDVAMPSKILVTTSEAIYEKWEKFIGDPRIHSYVGSLSESAILDAMISECYATWISVAQANQDE